MWSLPIKKMIMTLLNMHGTVIKDILSKEKT